MMYSPGKHLIPIYESTINRNTEVGYSDVGGVRDIIIPYRVSKSIDRKRAQISGS